MAVRIRKSWVVAALVLALVALLGWAWRDGGEQTLRDLSAPTNLPQVVQ